MSSTAASNRPSPGHRPRRMLVMGTPVSSGNRGVMALAASCVELIRQADPKACIEFLDIHAPVPDVIFSTTSGPCPVRVHTCRLSPKAVFQNHLLWVLLLAVLHRLVPLRSFRSLLRRNAWIDAAASADFVGDIRGGDSFSDIYGFYRFACASAAVWSVILVRGSITHLPQTYGPFRGRLARAIGAHLLRRSDLVIARDKNSRAVAERLLGGTRHVLQTPDVAFALPVHQVERASTRPTDFDFISPGLIGLNINALMYHGGYGGRDMFSLALDYPQFVESLIDTLLARTDARILLVPHVFAPDEDVESDNGISARIFERHSERAGARLALLDGNYDQHELKGFIARCEFFIGSRMHSCIAALSQGIPCVGVAYSMKFAGVFETVAMEHWVIDGRSVAAGEAVKRTLDLFNQRTRARESIRPLAESARTRLRTEFSRMLIEARSPQG